MDVRGGRTRWTTDAPVGVKSDEELTRETEVSLHTRLGALRSLHTREILHILGEEKYADLMKDPDFMLEAVRRDILLFGHASKELRENPAFVVKVLRRFEMKQLEAVLDMFRRRSLISIEASSNPDFMVPIVRDQRVGLRAVEFIASEKLKANQEFMLEVVRIHGLRAIVHASDDLKANDDFMLEVVRMWGAQAIVHASDDLKEDDEFMLKVLRTRRSSTHGDTDVPQAIKMKIAFSRLMDKDPEFVNKAAKWGWKWNSSTEEPELRRVPESSLGEEIRRKAEQIFAEKDNKEEEVFIDGQNKFSQPVGSQNKLSSTPPTP